MKLSKEQRKKISEALEEGVMEINYFGEVYDWKNAEDLYKVCIKQQKEIERLHFIIKKVREIFKDYGNKEDIVGYTMYNITGEMLLNLLEILDKENK